jgi:hypothetical protein
MKKVHQNEEEAWLHHTLKEFEYVANSHKYGPIFYEMLSKDTKTILNNAYELEKRDMICKLLLD